MTGNVARILAEQVRRRRLVDVCGDRLRAEVGLTQADEAVRGLDLHEHEVRVVARDERGDSDDAGRRRGHMRLQVRPGTASSARLIRYDT